MRGVGVLGLAVILAACWAVPLPWVVESPATVVEVGPAVSVTFAAATPAPPRVTGTFLASSPQVGATAARLLAAALTPGRVVRDARPQPANVLEQPAMVAALRGLGLAPARMEGAPLPVRAQVSAGVDPESAAAWLHIFDTTSPLDVARGRTVAAVARVAPDETLECVSQPGDAVGAARGAGADVVIVAAGCDGVPRGRGIVRAATFFEAVQALRPRAR